MTVHFTVPGEPQGKSRPRVVRGKDGRTHSYTPEKTAQYEALIRREYRRQGGVRFPDGAVLSVRLVAWYAVPKSASKQRRAAMLAGELLPTKKPDLDNIAKAICDALNGIAYHDDAQIVELYAEKRWDEIPRVDVEIREVGA